MKKYLLFYVSVAISCGIFIGCSNSDNNISSVVKGSIHTESAAKENVLGKLDDTTDWEPTNYKTVNNFSGVTMSIKKEAVTANGLTVVFKNSSDKMGMYGSTFSLEKKVNGKWYQVPVVFKGNYVFTDIGYKADYGKDREWKVEWKWLYGSLNAGEYRIVKDILDFRKTGDYDKYFMAAEFTLQL